MVLRYIAAAFLACFLLSAAAQAGDDKDRAVSAPNAKVSLEGGIYDDERAFLALGSFTIPLGSAFGVQLDGAVGQIDSDLMSGGGMHIFARDPSSHLLGLYGSRHEWNGIAISRAAAEFELYLHRFTVTGLVGYEELDVPAFSQWLRVANTDDGHAFGHVDLGYYLTDDLKIHVGYRYLSEISLGAAGVEYLLRDTGSPISLFAKSRFGNAEATRVTAGLKIYFGADSSKSLIRRHRTEDPPNYTPVFPDIVTRPNPPLPCPQNECPR